MIKALTPLFISALVITFVGLIFFEAIRVILNKYYLGLSNIVDQGGLTITEYMQSKRKTLFLKEQDFYEGGSYAAKEKAIFNCRKYFSYLGQHWRLQKGIALIVSVFLTVLGIYLFTLGLMEKGSDPSSDIIIGIINILIALLLYRILFIMERIDTIKSNIIDSIEKA